jgi:5-methyltetrahydrofolate--homocysteine methyltransferase
VDEVVACIDLNTLYRMQWGAKNLKGEEWDRMLREEFEPRLKRYTREARTQGWLRPRAVYGYFPAGRDGDDLVVFDPATGRARSAASPSRARRTASGSASPTTSARSRTAPARGRGGAAGGDQRRPRRGVHRPPQRGRRLQRGLLPARLQRADRRGRRGAGEPAGAQELGLEGERGLRYSWGYPAMPDVEQHEVLFRAAPGGGERSACR